MDVHEQIAEALLETTFSGKRELKILQRAKEKGFKTNLIFVGLPDPE